MYSNKFKYGSIKNCCIDIQIIGSKLHINSAVHKISFLVAMFANTTTIQLHLPI